jgi:hypothetical protein
MERFLKSLFHGVLIFSALLYLASCAGVQPQVAKPQEGPAPKFKLSTAGLAQTGMWKSTPLVMDINGDGHLDVLAISRLGDGAHVWLGDGKGNWTDSSAGLRMKGGSCGGGIAVGDINRDGFLDLAVGDHCSGVYVYLADGTGKWIMVTEGLYPSTVKSKVIEKDEELKSVFIGAEDIALGDINGDGLLDIVAAASDQGGFEVFLGDGKGKIWKELPANGLPDMQNPEPDDEDNAGWANQVKLIDINKDGKPDVVATYYKGPRVWLGDGKGHFQSASDGLPTPLIGGLYRGIDFGDVNGDGLIDIMTANDVNGPELYLQQPGGSWKYTGDLMPQMQNGAVGVALGDFDKDGLLDLVLAGRKVKEMGNNYGLFLLKGDGKGGFTELTATNLPPKGLSVSWGLAVGDVNEDGLLDFAATTGGAVAGGTPKGQPVPPKRGDKAAQKPSTKAPTDVIAELPLPRMQVWVNEGVK